ncbi:hypothetical protein ACVWYG_003639 [Pedobacter sp. UYEF25]
MNGIRINIKMDKTKNCRNIKIKGIITNNLYDL